MLIHLNHSRWSSPPLCCHSLVRSFSPSLPPYVNEQISPYYSTCIYNRMSMPFLSDSANPNVWKGKRYDIPNEALVGACFLPSGLGTICKFFISGYLNASLCLKIPISSWGTNSRTNIRLHGDHLEEEARWCMVSRGPIKGVLDSVCSFGPNTIARIRSDKQICWREARPHRMSHMPFPQWVRGELVIMLIRVATQYSWAIVQVEMTFGACSAYIIDVMHSKSTKSLAAIGWGASPTRTDDRTWSLTPIDWKGSAICSHGRRNSSDLTYDQHLRDCGYERRMCRHGIDIIRVRSFCSSFHAFLIPMLCQDSLLYHSVWGLDESVSRRWFFDQRE